MKEEEEEEEDIRAEMEDLADDLLTAALIVLLLRYLCVCEWVFECLGFKMWVDVDTVVKCSRAFGHTHKQTYSLSFTICFLTAALFPLTPLHSIKKHLYYYLFAAWTRPWHLHTCTHIHIQ